MKLRATLPSRQWRSIQRVVLLNGLEQADLAGRLAVRKVKETLRKVPQ